jgi:nucleoside-diphosphate-sugar epimerase
VESADSSLTPEVSTDNFSIMMQMRLIVSQFGIARIAIAAAIIFVMGMSLQSFLDLASPLSSLSSSDPKVLGVDPCQDMPVAGLDPADATTPEELVLVTGASGFIGSTLTEKLLKLGYRVRAFDNLETGNIINLDLRHPRLEFFYGDIKNLEDLRSAMKGVKGVFHLAAASKVLPSLKDPKMATFNVDMNAIGTANLLEAANETKMVQKVIYAASSTYYGNQRHPFKEDDQFVPSSPYAASKYMGELQMLTYDSLYNLPTLSLRFFMVYGPRNPSTGAYAIVTGKFVGRLLEGKDLVIEGTGKQFRDFIHVDDIARGLIMGYQSQVRATVINLGTGIKYSVKEVADLVSPKQVFAPPRRNDLNGTLGNTCRAKKLLGFKTKKDFVNEMKFLIEKAKEGKGDFPAPFWQDDNVQTAVEARLPGWKAANHHSRGALVRDAVRADRSFLDEIIAASQVV